MLSLWLAFGFQPPNKRVSSKQMKLKRAAFGACPSPSRWINFDGPVDKERSKVSPGQLESILDVRFAPEKNANGSCAQRDPR